MLEDEQKRSLMRREQVVDHVSTPPKRPLSPFVSIYLDVPEGFPPGTYTVRLLARDGFGERSAAARVGFVVAQR